MRYAIVIERPPELLGLCARLAGLHRYRATVAEVEQEMRAAIRFHIEGLEEDGLPCPSVDRSRCRRGR